MYEYRPQVMIDVYIGEHLAVSKLKSQGFDRLEIGPITHLRRALDVFTIATKCFRILGSTTLSYSASRPEEWKHSATH